MNDKTDLEDNELSFEQQQNENFKKKCSEIKSCDSKFLAAQLVIYKALGIDREFALACMEELATRRKNGDDFEYESFIEEELAKIPDFKNILDLKKILKAFQANKNIAIGLSQRSKP